MHNERYAYVTKGIAKNNAHLSIFLDASIVIFKQSERKNLTALLAWGNKPSAHKARSTANAYNLPTLTLEDGFLRSLSGGTHSRHACSLVVDDLGIYFDTKQPSRLEQLILHGSSLSPAQTARCRSLIDNINNSALSKYNLAPYVALTKTTPENILLIDQTFGDQSVVGAGGDQTSFANMLRIAKQNHPHATLWIKAHPQAKQRSKSSPAGYFDDIAPTEQIRLISEAANPIALIAQMDAVYTVSSHMGFEALMLGKPVYCFGVSWYAGWGLTHDDHAPKQQLDQVLARRGLAKRSLLELFHAAYIDYTRYVNPATQTRCEIEQAITWLTTNRDWALKLDKELALYRISAWKLTFFERFFAASNSAFHISYVLASRLRKQGIQQAVVWGLRKRRLAQPLFQHIWCAEDGFIRSKGLGASLIAPLSIVLDGTGIYYDANQPSDLENTLNHIQLNEAQRARAQKLIQLLVDNNISKYNVGDAAGWPDIAPNKQVILVPGQVEDDLSVLNCLSTVKTNLELLKHVRIENPDAFIVYKPHPDVQAELRAGHIAAGDINQYADACVVDASMPYCLARVDAVATISSLTGFEALLRGKTVTCYGLPFYAGWGLTQDKKTSPRRKRTLSLEALVYAAIIAYPLYHLPHGHGLAQAEEAIAYLSGLSDNNAYTNKQSALKKLMQWRHRLLSFITK